MRVVFMGTPAFALPILDGLLSQRHVVVVAVYTAADRPAGRGRRVAPSPVKAWAEQRGVPVFQPPSLRRQGAIDQLKSLAPEVLIVAAYGRLLPAEVLAVPPLGALNLHPSLLPRYRGPSPVATAILEGEEETGVTVMLLDVGMDTGPILAQRLVPILPGETTDRLTQRLFDVGAGLLLEVLPAWKAGNLSPVAQDEAQATYTRLITKEEGEMDWAQPALVLERRLRAFHPWPGCYSRWEGRLLKLIAGVAQANPGREMVAMGQVVALAEKGAPQVGVTTGEGVLRLTRVQLEGGTPQSLESFLRGHPGFLGARLPS